MQHSPKRCVLWALLISGHPVWSFRIISAIAFGRPIRRGILPRTTSGNMIRMAGLDRVPTPAEAGKCDIVACAREPFLGLKPVVTGFLAAMCVLAAEPGLTLSADVNPSARSPAASEMQGNAMPSTKLEGELAAQFQKAQAAGSVQQFDKAKKLYDQVVKYAPGYVYGWSNRANVRIAEGDLKGAISDYDRALELADSLNMPDKWIIHLNRGTTYLALGDNDRALADLDQAAVLNKQKDLYILANRAQAHERKEDWASALRDYEGAINAQPGNVQPWWIRYSLVLFQQERDFDSLAFLRRLQSKFEGVGEIQAAVTAVEFGRGNFAAAEQAWMGINPVDRRMYLNGSYLQDQLKWPPRVIESLKAFDHQQKEMDARPLETSKLATLT